jgi:putative ABC transport system ATP-binding protein
MAIIELDKITRSYMLGGQELRVLKGITLRIEEGEFVAIMGPSGSGKSTLMQIMGLLDRPTSGSYRLLGLDVSRLTDDEGAALRSKTIGFIFQMFNLLARTTALDNVMLPMIYSGAPNRLERSREVLEDVGLSDRMGHKPNQLSGGQQQRVAIARALITEPSIVLADEPTGNLDSRSGIEVMSMLQELEQRGITVVLVTHDANIARHAARVVEVADGKVISDTAVTDRLWAKDRIPQLEEEKRSAEAAREVEKAAQQELEEGLKSGADTEGPHAEGPDAS